MDQWQSLISILQNQVRLRLPSSLIVDGESAFEIAQGYDSIEEYHRARLGSISATDIAFTWMATHITLTQINTQTSVYTGLFERINTFLTRTQGTPLTGGIEQFDSLVKRYMNAELTAEQLDAIRMRILNIERIRDYLATVKIYTHDDAIDQPFMFRMTSKDIEVHSGILYPVDGTIDIFDKIKADKRLPFVAYRSGPSTRLFKLHDDNKGVQLNVPIGEVGWIEELSRAPAEVAVLAKLYARDKITESEYNSKAAYIDVWYTEFSNSFRLTYTPKLSVDLHRVYQDLISHIGPLANLSGAHEMEQLSKVSNVIGSFIVRGLHLDKVVFPSILMNHPLISTFAYINEDQKVVSKRKRITMQLDFEPQIHLWVTLKAEVAKDSETATLTNGKLVRLDKDEPYIAVQIRGMRNEDMAPWARDIVLKIFNIYVTEYNRIAAQYQAVIPRYKPDLLYIVPKDSKVKKNNSNLDKLQEMDPNLFIPGYASKVQSKSQPTWISEEQALVEIAKGRQVLRIPAYINNSAVQFTDTSYKNYYVSNIPDKPFLGLVKNLKSNCVDYPYNIAAYKAMTVTVNPKDWSITILKERIGKKSGGHKEYVLDVGKIMEVDRRGALRTRISLLLELDDSVNEENNIFVRLGMPESTSSLLHALYYASHKSYLDEDGIVALRKDMALKQGTGSFPYMAVMAQERYDYTLSEMQDEWLDHKDYILDSEQDYRLLEEYFNVNIVVFTVNSVNEEPIIEMPRHRYFHLATQKTKMVLLYKHMNKKTLDCHSLNLPIHYELIIQKGKRNSVITTFTEARLLERIWGLISYMRSTVEMEIDPYPATHVRHTSVKAVSLPPLALSRPGVFTQQQINAQGRIEALIHSDGTRIDVASPGAAPINLPMITESVATRPKLRKVATIMSGIATVLTVLNKEPRLEFARRTVVVSNVNYIASMLQIPRTYPYFSSYEEAFEFFYNLVPAFFSTGNPYTFRFVVPDAKTAMGMSTTIRSVFQTQITNQIPNYYQAAQDFTVFNRNQLIMLSVDDAYNKIAYIQERNSRPLINTDTIRANSLDPYTIANNGRLFLVQQVILGEKRHAMAVVDNWKRMHINSGPFTIAEPDKVFENIVEHGQYNQNIHITESCIALNGTHYFALLKL